MTRRLVRMVAVPLLLLAAFGLVAAQNSTDEPTGSASVTPTFQTVTSSSFISESLKETMTLSTTMTTSTTTTATVPPPTMEGFAYFVAGSSGLVCSSIGCSMVLGGGDKYDRLCPESSKPTCSSVYLSSSNGCVVNRGGLSVGACPGAALFRRLWSRQTDVDFLFDAKPAGESGEIKSVSSGTCLVRGSGGGVRLGACGAADASFEARQAAPTTTTTTTTTTAT